MFCHWETGKAADAMIYEPGDLPGCCTGTCSSGPRVTGSTVIFVQGPLYLFLISRGLSLCARLTLDHMGSRPGIPGIFRLHFLRPEYARRAENKNGGMKNEEKQNGRIDGGVLAAALW